MGLFVIAVGKLVFVDEILTLLHSLRHLISLRPLSLFPRLCKQTLCFFNFGLLTTFTLLSCD